MNAQDNVQAPQDPEIRVITGPSGEKHSTYVVDPETGYSTSTANFALAFTPQRKKAFLAAYYKNNLAFYRTCEEIGINYKTLNHAVKIDPVFAEHLELTEKRFTDELETISRSNAKNPRSVIERIFQLKALLPEKYADTKRESKQTIVISIDSKLLEDTKAKINAIDAQVVDNKHSPENTVLMDNNASNVVKEINNTPTGDFPTE